MDERLRRLKRAHFTGDTAATSAYIRELERLSGVSFKAESDYEFEITLTVGTLHISGNESSFLESNYENLNIVNTQYYYLIPTYLLYADYLMKEQLPNIVNLLRLAVDLKCDYLKLDVDGPKIEGLPIFDW